METTTDPFDVCFCLASEAEEGQNVMQIVPLSDNMLACFV